MRLLMVHNDYARPSGEEHAAQAIADLLENHGHRVEWFRKSSAELADSLAGNLAGFFSGIHSPSSRRGMAGKLNGGNFDIVQVQNIYPQLSPSIFKPCRERGIPVVMRCPNYRLFCPNGLHLSRGEVCERCVGGKEWWCVVRNCTGNRTKSLGYAIRNAAARITRRIVDNVSVFIVQSEFQKHKFASRGIEAKRIAVVPNFESSCATDGTARGVGETISFVGRLSPEKGIVDFIEAARRLPEFPFAVAGETNSMPELVARAPANVRFEGFLSGDALNAFYRRTRVFVCPSVWYEGFPNVVTRAMAHGKPVVASRIGALPEIVDDVVSGLLFQPGNAEDLADKLDELYRDQARCAEMGQAGQARVRSEFSSEAVYERLMAVYARAREMPIAV